MNKFYRWCPDYETLQQHVKRQLDVPTPAGEEVDD